jgi:hypothetical protein
VAHVDAQKIPTSGEIVTEIIADFLVDAPGRRPIFPRGGFFVGFFLGGQAIIQPWQAKSLSATGGVTARAIHDWLEREFGANLLFMDVDAIPLTPEGAPRQLWRSAPFRPARLVVG